MLSREAALALLSSDLASISDWGKENLFNFNASRTQFLHITNRRNTPNIYPITFNSCQLKLSQTINILGVNFSSDVTWKDHITNLTKLGSQRLEAVRHLSGFFQFITITLHLSRFGIQFTHMGWFHPYRSTRSPGFEGNSPHCLSFSHYLFNSPMYSLQYCLFIPLLQILSQPLLMRALKLCPSTPPEVSQYQLSITKPPFSVQLSNPRLNRFS